jgi:hypothetical protein
VTCRFAFDDGVYILGALSPSERGDYERHLPGCASCRHSVARLAVLPGLLGRLDTERALPEVQAPATLLPRVLATAAARRRALQRAEILRKRWYAVAASVAAASLAAVVGVAVHTADTRGTTATVRPSGPVLTAMRPLQPGLPVTAEVALVPVAGGTRVEMRCRYADHGEDEVWTVRLVVYARNRAGMEEIGSWIAEGGQEISMSSVTYLTPQQIDRVELHTQNHYPLLTWTPI